MGIIVLQSNRRRRPARGQSSPLLYDFRLTHSWRVTVCLAAALTLNACGGDPVTPSSGLSAPTLATPPSDAVSAVPPVLTVNNAAASTQSGIRTYDFQVADSQTALGSGTTGAGTTLLASVTGIAEGTGGQTSYRLEAPLQPAKRYFWRARAVQGGVAGPWSGTFRFRTDFAPNGAPVIQSLTASSDRAEVDASVQLSAVVQDQETSPGSLIYEWSATGGSFTGTGAAVSWRAPTIAGPTEHRLTLAVIERYMVIDPDGAQQARENRVSENVTIHVNNSQSELTILAQTFLDDFVHSDRAPEYCVRYFTDSCMGKQWELDDLRKNRAEFINDPSRSSFSIASVTYNASRTRATVLAPCNFAATEKQSGQFGVARGTCRLVNVYEGWHWHLCESWFDPPPTGTFDAFSRGFIF